MPFYNIPRNGAEFKSKFAFINDIPQRKRLLDLIVRVNRLIEKGDDRVKTHGSFAYYNNLVFVHTTKKNRGHGYYFYPTETMKKPLKDDNVTEDVLFNIAKYAHNRGLENCIFWEFFSCPENIWVSALSQIAALDLFHEGYKKWDDPLYAAICEGILETFKISWKKGGVKDHEWNWYLEYPMYIEQNPRMGVRRVLNCHLDCLIYLYRYWEDTDNKLAYRLYKNGEKELRNKLESFIFPDNRTSYSYWQSQHPDPKIREKSYNERYHGLHITRIHQMWTMTGNKFYKTIRNKLMKVKVTTPYDLIPYNVEIMAGRWKKVSCPNCKLPDIRCKGCEVKE
jgi:hypothetical protein